MSKTTDSTDQFDAWLNRPGTKRRKFLHDASIDCRDTLVGCWYAVRTVFGDKATPEQALTLLPLVMERADSARRQLQSEIAGRTAPGGEPPQE